MDPSERRRYHMAIVAPLREDYVAAKALLHSIDHEHSLTPSGSECILGKIGSHHLVLVGNAEVSTDVSVSVENTVTDLLREYPSIRAGFLIGVDAKAPRDGIARPGDVVVGSPQGLEPGVVQFDADKTTTYCRLSATHQMNRPPSAVQSAITSLATPSGRKEWEQYLEHQLSQATPILGSTSEQEVKDVKGSTKVFYGKIASSQRPLEDSNLLDKIGRDGNVLCFEQAAASLKPQLPFLTICGITRRSNSNADEWDIDRRVREAAVMYTIFLASEINAMKLGGQHAFANLFGYEPFDLERPGFRLVQLQGGSRFPLECRIFQAYLDDEESIIPYEALSYAWGEQNTPEEIIMNGKHMFVTTSLHDALCHLRRPNEDRILWVDALCIDQSNINERGHQVRHMGEIYGKADNVVIWLGLVDSDAGVLMSAINKFKRIVPPEAFRTWPREDPRWREQWLQLELDEPDVPKSISGLWSFMKKPWFTRVWILQEVANARKALVECNYGNIHAKTFAILPQLLGVEVDDQCQAVLDIMPGPAKLSSWWSQERNLCTLLWRFRGCQATDPRDRVYALLGMASDMTDKTIQADYSKDEQSVVEDLWRYIFDEELSIYDSDKMTIQDLQSELPQLSTELLQERLEGMASLDSMERFLSRQGTMKKLPYDCFPDVIKHGSKVVELLLNRNDSPFQLTPDAALKSFQTNLEVFEFFLQKRLLSTEAVNAVWLEILGTQPGEMNSFLEKLGVPTQPTPNIVLKAIKQGKKTLQRVLESCEHPIEMKDFLLSAAINKGIPTLRLLLENCQHPFEVSEDILMKAVETGLSTLQLLFEEWDLDMEITERATREAITADMPALMFLMHNSKSKLQITDRVLCDAQPETDVYELLSARRAEEVDVPEDEAIQAIQNGTSALNTLLDRPGTNFRVTQRIFAAASEEKHVLDILWRRRQSEVDVLSSYTHRDVGHPQDTSGYAFQRTYD
ncbi:hypothetical protein FSARC_4384 [Fusarium sarcochroum]|uniref:Heterokaryon incompatibility domain-containing protein n=1 Tax=Fusarium sarcochroum TaxID=1208366 RepID=A0A8H4XBK9_9HYPO|nr:hypothetical protein FSARC_4384 [Fusarium sarcochroum]